MQKFKLKYGRSDLTLQQSETLIGLRPRQNGNNDALGAIRRELKQEAWRDAGVIGGFHIIAIEDASINVDQTLDVLRRDGSVAVGTHVFELPAGAGIYVPTGELFVEFKAGTSNETKEKALDEFDLVIKEARGSDAFIVSVTPSSPNPIKVAAALQAKAEISVAEPDLATKTRVKSFQTPTDILLGEQWHLRNTGTHRGTRTGFVAGADARVIEAWEKAQTIGSANITIAIIDDGFDLAHPDLSRPGKTVHPWDFTRQSADPRPDWGDWHGTACAGVALAASGGGGVVGAAPGCTLMPIRWGPDLSDRQLEAWFGYVTTKGAHVVSCSWGALNPFFPLSTRAERAIARCAREGRGGLGCIVVFAAGNENRDINNPGNGSVDGFAIHPDVIAVAASTSRDRRSNYSNFGKEISICAPSSGAGGWGVLTSDVSGIDAAGRTLGYAQDEYTWEFGGTSSACPLVAGIVGLILSINSQLTQIEVKDILERTARRIGPQDGYDANGHSREFGYGCINASAAVQEVMASGRQQSTSVARAKPRGKRTNKEAVLAKW